MTEKRIVDADKLLEWADDQIAEIRKEGNYSFNAGAVSQMKILKQYVAIVATEVDINDD